MNIKFVHIIFFISICIFVIGVLSKLNAPLADWDFEYFSDAQNLAGFNLEHPPLYTIFLALIFKIFKVSVPVVRLANAFCILVIALIIYLFAAMLGNKKAGLWAAIIYLINPVTIQGSTLLDHADATLLPLEFIILFWLMFRAFKSKNYLSDIIAIGITTGFCFWSKVTSTLALLPGLFLYALIQPKGLNRGWFKIILGITLGIGIFIITWTFIAIPFWGKEVWLLILKAPWVNLRHRIMPGISISKLTIFIFYIFRFVLWFSPFLVLLFLGEILSIWRNRNTEKDSKGIILLGSIGFFYFFGHLIAGGLAHGFPRYHAAILPLMALFAAVLIEPVISNLKRGQIYFLFAIATILVLMGFFLFEDPLLFFNLKLKEIILAGKSIAPGAVKHFMQILICFCIAWLGVSFLKNTRFMQKIILTLFICLVTWSLNFDLLQAKADYTTSYNYGTKGKQEVINFVSDSIEKNDLVLATPDILYELRHKGVPYVDNSIWLFPEKVEDSIKTMNPEAIVFGLTTHTLKHWQYIKQPEFQSILNQKYRIRRIGTYTVWIKKNGKN